MGEKVTMVVSKLLDQLIPANYWPTAATAVAWTLLARGRVVLLSGEMQG